MRLILLSIVQSVLLCSGQDGRFCMDMAILRPSAYKLVVAWLRNMLWYGHGDVDVYRSHISFFYGLSNGQS